jgi:hypothetical protein
MSQSSGTELILLQSRLCVNRIKGVGFKRRRERSYVIAEDKALIRNQFPCHLQEA